MRQLSHSGAEMKCARECNNDRPDPIVPDPMAPDPMAPDPTAPDPMAPDPMAPDPKAPDPMAHELQLRNGIAAGAQQVQQAVLAEQVAQAHDHEHRFARRLQAGVEHLQPALVAVGNQ